MDRSVALTEQTASLAGINVVRRGSSTFVSASDAIAFLDAADSLKVHVLGIEGFYLQEEFIAPDPDVIADFSLIESQKKSILEAKNFTKTISNLRFNELLLEFVLNSNR